MILMILNSLTILTALVAAREALDWEASWATEEVVEVEKMMSVIKLTSKIIEIVDSTSRKKKNDRKYPSSTKVLRMISVMKIPITAKLKLSKIGSTGWLNKAVRKSSEKSEYKVSSVMKIWYFKLYSMTSTFPEDSGKNF